MPELHFKGKEYVYNHHLNVPFRPLLTQPDKSIGEDSGNLIIHGDNLHALKALLPRYADKVDCIFIDPPYNTGNENWCYNDNANSPIMRDWLNSNPVNKEDMLRHDKWLAMMWPRLKLLHELLAENGSFWMTLDDNEVHRARMMLDEIFEEDNFVSTSVWQKRQSPDSDETFLTAVHDSVICYAKCKNLLSFTRLERTEEADNRYENPDNDPRGCWTSSDLTRREYREHDFYPIKLPSEREVYPSSGRSWSIPRESFKNLVEENRVWFGPDGNAMPRRKRFLSEVSSGLVSTSWWNSDLVGTNQAGKKEISSIFSERNDVFQTPKPTSLLSRILQLATDVGSVILDSFAGSATTAHAVLAQNAKDGGNRQFILVECEDYADTLTAERVRRVINGYEFSGNQKEELYREKINWTNFSKEGPHHKLLQYVQSIENLDGFRFDNINVECRGNDCQNLPGQTAFGFCRRQIRAESFVVTIGG